MESEGPLQQDEGIKNDPVFEFESEMQVNKFRLILKKCYKLRDDLVYFKELSQTHLLPINRVKKISDESVDYGNQQPQKFFTPFEFNEEIQKRLQSIKSIKIELSNLLKYADENQIYGLDKKEYDYISAKGDVSSIDFHTLVDSVSSILTRLETEYNRLIIVDEKRKKGKK